MNDQRTRSPRLFVIVHFIAAAGILLGGLVVRSMTDTTAGDAGWVLPLAALLCAFEVGMGIGEWRGLRYANHVRARQATSCA
jgi:hypothetical protein